VSPFPALITPDETIITQTCPDNENNDASFYTTFATALRAQYAKDNTKAYYLSVAPQCQRPEASIPLSVIRQADFVWVQFYNNLACNVGSPGFNDSFEAWSMDLAQTSTRPKLFLGVLAFADGGSGYVQPAELVSVLKDVKALGGSNFGGVMLWDGTEAHKNIDPQGLDYVQVAKAALR